MNPFRRCGRAAAAAVAVAVTLLAMPALAQEPPALTGAVNDFAGLLDADSVRLLETLSRSLQQASGDVVVVATVDSIEPYGDMREYAVKMFENRGRGIGDRGKDNGLLVIVAARERQVRIEVGYDLEQFITDGFAGETVRQTIAPDFRRGNYGAGLVAGVSRVVARIAQGRNVVLQGVPTTRTSRPATGSGGNLIVAIFVIFMVLNALARTRRRGGRGRFGRGGWSGWNSGVGPFGGGSFGGGFGGFGGGGGFGGFGGGRSGGGGGGGSW